ncbi:MAG: hypothetical protein ACR2P0_14090 [Acidimicrobiales bacterium]
MMDLKNRPADERVEEVDGADDARWYDHIPAPGVTTPVQRWDFGRSKLRRWLRRH